MNFSGLRAVTGLGWAPATPEPPPPWRRSSRMPGGKQPGWHGRAGGLLLLLRVRLDPPHSGPAAASRGETEAPPSCGCCASLLAPAAVSFPARALVALLGMARSHVEMAGPSGHLMLGCAGTGTPSSGASHGELGVGTVWGWHPSSFLAPARGDAASAFLPAAAVGLGREDSHPTHLLPPHPGCLQPLPAALSRRWPQRGFPAPRQECAGGFRPPARRGRFLFQRYLSGSRRVPPGRAMERLEVTETFEGIALPGHLHTQESLGFAAAFTFRPTDVLIATYPKSGTTWMQEILTLLFSLGDARPAKTIPNWERAPWLEQIYSREALRDTGSPRLLTTHLPAHVLAPALQRSKAKVIYVARNPKDVAVSFYHFHHLAKFLPDPSSFDAFLTQFLEGTVHYGSWFDHVKGWLGQRHLLDILYVTYEELHQDLRGTAQRLSSFLGCPLAPGTLAALEQHCSFSAMRDNAMANYSLIPAEIMDHSQGRFMRKGVVGDWRSHFSPEQNALFNRRYQEEMGDTELPSQWPMA